jgi:hypothetical protein
MEYFDAGGKSVFSGFVPASPGDTSLSFLGIVFSDARIVECPQLDSTDLDM